MEFRGFLDRLKTKTPKPRAAAPAPAEHGWYGASPRWRALRRGFNVLINLKVPNGLGSSAAAILLAQHHPGQEAAAFDRVFAVRPRSWPNARMVAFADRLLGRRGAMLSALKDHHRRVLQHHPEIADVLRGYGRSARPGE